MFSWRVSFPEIELGSCSFGLQSRLFLYRPRFAEVGKLDVCAGTEAENGRVFGEEERRMSLSSPMAPYHVVGIRILLLSNTSITS